MADLDQNQSNTEEQQDKSINKEDAKATTDSSNNEKSSTNKDNENKNEDGPLKMMWSMQCAVCKKDCNKRCTGCLRVAYCSEACQRSHRPEHKQFCSRTKAENVPNEISTDNYLSEFLAQHPKVAEKFQMLLMVVRATPSFRGVILIDEAKLTCDLKFMSEKDIEELAAKSESIRAILQSLDKPNDHICIQLMPANQQEILMFRIQATFVPRSA